MGSGKRQRESSDMGIGIEELDYRQTRLGELILRRRKAPSMGGAEVFEITLDGSFLMSSMVNVSEIALSELGLAELAHPGTEAEPLDVVVGGLGLGYSASAALAHPGVGSVLVIEYLDEVIDWHRRGLVPLGEPLTKDPRCRMVSGSFFAMFNDGDHGFDPETPGRLFNAILLDIDHTPKSHLHPSHATLYTPEGLRRLATHLKPGGVFALWSAGPPEDDFLNLLGEAYETARAHAIDFYNPHLDLDDINTIYIARKAD